MLPTVAVCTELGRGKGEAKQVGEETKKKKPSDWPEVNAVVSVGWRAVFVVPLLDSQRDGTDSSHTRLTVRSLTLDI